MSNSNAFKNQGGGFFTNGSEMLMTREVVFWPKKLEHNSTVIN